MLAATMLTALRGAGLRCDFERCDVSWIAFILLRQLPAAKAVQC